MTESGAPYAEIIDITERDDGKADVQIDGGEVFILQPYLWRILWILRDDRRRHNGRFVDFKKKGDIRDGLEDMLRDAGKLPARAITTRSVRQNICRIRKVLEAAGYSRDLIECRRYEGYRVRLLRVAELGYGT